MAFGPHADASLILVDVSAPGAPTWIVSPFQKPDGRIGGTLRLPTVDANGGELTGLMRLAVASNKVGFNQDDQMETILADSSNDRQIIDVSGSEPGSDVEIDMAAQGVSGEQFFRAACDDTVG